MPDRSYEQEAKPGSIIFIPGVADSRDSLFSIVPHLNEDFNKGRYERTLSTFTNKDGRYTRVPCWLMREDFNWRLYISSLSPGCFVIGDILDEDEERRKSFMRMFGCFTHRDGSRYYAEFHHWLKIFQTILADKDAYGKYAPWVQRDHGIVIESIRNFRLPSRPPVAP